jgi:hypothetical protein
VEGAAGGKGGYLEDGYIVHGRRSIVCIVSRSGNGWQEVLEVHVHDLPVDIDLGGAGGQDLQGMQAREQHGVLRRRRGIHMWEADYIRLRQNSGNSGRLACMG